MKIKWTCLLLAALFFLGCVPVLFAEEVEEEKINFRSFVPQTIHEAMNALDQRFTAEEIEKIKNLHEGELESFFNDYTHWVRNTWIVQTNAPLYDLFISKGVDNPDTMARIVLMSYYRRLNRRYVDIDKQIQELDEKK